jgi:hypothetical protein
MGFTDKFCFSLFGSLCSILDIGFADNLCVSLCDSLCLFPFFKSLPGWNWGCRNIQNIGQRAADHQLIHLGIEPADGRVDRPVRLARNCRTQSQCGTVEAFRATGSKYIDDNCFFLCLLFFSSSLQFKLYIFLGLMLPVINC